MLLLSVALFGSSTSVDKRPWYAHSLRSCPLARDGTRESDGVIVSVNEEIILRRRLQKGVTSLTPAEHYAARLAAWRPASVIAARSRSATPRLQVEHIFNLISAVKVTGTSNASVEAMLDDDEAAIVEADCAVHQRPPSDAPLVKHADGRRLSSQSNAPWNLDALDGSRDGSYSFGGATGRGVWVYVLDSGVCVRASLRGAHARRSAAHTALRMTHARACSVARATFARPLRARASSHRRSVRALSCFLLSRRVSHSEFGNRAHAGYSPRCRDGSEAACTHNGGTWPLAGVITNAVRCSPTHRFLAAWSCHRKRPSHHKQPRRHKRPCRGKQPRRHTQSPTSEE
jgi:hypothetical protein